MRPKDKQRWTSQKYKTLEYQSKLPEWDVTQGAYTHEAELNPQITHNVDANTDRDATKTVERQPTILEKMFAIHISYKSQIKRFLKPTTKPKSKI